MKMKNNIKRILNLIKLFFYSICHKINLKLILKEYLKKNLVIQKEIDKNTDIQVAKKILAIDFDGVINSYLSKWTFDYTDIPDPPIKDVQKYLKKLRERNYYIIIHSARVIDKYSYEIVKKYLDKNNIPYDMIWFNKGKPYAHLYIDDNALHFKGNWYKTYHQILRLTNNRN